eukprot:10078345-Lingulodinium_polyedra.AAC.1
MALAPEQRNLNVPLRREEDNLGPPAPTAGVHRRRPHHGLLLFDLGTLAGTQDHISDWQPLYDR